MRTKKKWIRISVLALSLCASLIFGGCKYLFPTEEYKLELFLEQKYGEDFTYTRTVEYHAYGSQEAYIFSSASHPEAEILARYDTSTGRNNDNYTDILYEEQACEVVKKTLENVYGDVPFAACIYDYRESDLPDVYAFEDYMKFQTPNILAVMYYDIPEEKIQEYIDITEKAVNDSESPFNVALFIETDAPDLDGFNRYAITTYASGNTYDHLVMTGDSLFYF